LMINKILLLLSCVLLICSTLQVQCEENQKKPSISTLFSKKFKEKFASLKGSKKLKKRSFIIKQPVSVAGVRGKSKESQKNPQLHEIELNIKLEKSFAKKRSLFSPTSVMATICNHKGLALQSFTLKWKDNPINLQAQAGEYILKLEEKAKGGRQVNMSVKIQSPAKIVVLANEKGLKIK
ncbi:MAG: hypothetical protein HQL32_18045, partial [Planctomycetes bacterium]|nr:hypothetical protein [Planctomycetota bacterium]